jgi:hypothetical protein
MFGSGVDVGQTVNSGFTVDTNLSNPSSNTTLWPSNRIVGIVQFGAAMYKSTSFITLPASETKKAFSTGNDNVGPATWPTSGTTFSINSDGNITIFNSLSYDTYFKLSFSANNLTAELSNPNPRVVCSFNRNDNHAPIGIQKTLTKTNPVFMCALVAVDPGSSFVFYVNLTNSSSENMTIDAPAFTPSPSSPDLDISFITIERVA